MGIISRNWKIDTRDRFGLLLVACWYSIGNVNKRFEMLIEERVEII